MVHVWFCVWVPVSFYLLEQSRWRGRMDVQAAGPTVRRLTLLYAAYCHHACSLEPCWTSKLGIFDILGFYSFRDYVKYNSIHSGTQTWQWKIEVLMSFNRYSSPIFKRIQHAMFDDTASVAVVDFMTWRIHRRPAVLAASCVPGDGHGTGPRRPWPGRWPAMPWPHRGLGAGASEYSLEFSMGNRKQGVEMVAKRTRHRNSPIYNEGTKIRKCLVWVGNIWNSLDGQKQANKHN